jgi:hypothetical protein
MPVELTKKSWEKNKDWLVTGKELSTALGAYEASKAKFDAACAAAKDANLVNALIHDVQDDLKKVKAQIEKNQTKLDAKQHKDTHAALTTMLQLTKNVFAKVAVDGKAMYLKIRGQELMVKLSHEVMVVKTRIAIPGTLAPQYKAKVDKVLADRTLKLADLEKAEEALREFWEPAGKVCAYVANSQSTVEGVVKLSGITLAPEQVKQKDALFAEIQKLQSQVAAANNIHIAASNRVTEVIKKMKKAAA